MTFIDLNNSESKCDLNELRSYMLDTTNGLPDEAPASSFLGREEENGQPVVVLYTARSLAGKDVNLKIWTDVQGLECSDEHPIIEWPKPTYRLFRQAARLVCWFMLQREKGQVYQVPKYKALLANLNLSEESPYLPVHSVDEFGDCEKVLGTVFSLDPQTKPCVTLHRAMVTLHADDESLATGLNLKTVDTLPNVPVDSFLEQYDGFNVNSTTGVVHCTRECWRWIWDL